jgi:hypothetical protein
MVMSRPDAHADGQTLFRSGDGAGPSDCARRISHGRRKRAGTADVADTTEADTASAEVAAMVAVTP